MLTSPSMRIGIREQGDILSKLRQRSIRPDV